jgi:3-hydroxyacyl-CoA dehydrogenase
MNGIKQMAVLGANGTMGSLSGGIFAQAGVLCYFFARSMEKAQRGIENAVQQARSDVVREYIIPKTYDSLEAELPECDWVLEAVAENLPLKREYFRKVDRHRKRGSMVATISSSLSIEEMAEECSNDFKAHFMGVHFFNPPGKLLANELIFHSKNTDTLKASVSEFCEKRLGRVNIITCDTPGFAGNRIGFQFLNEAALYAEKLGVGEIDYLLGPQTGRVLPPLATIDLVGLDVHHEVVTNIYKRTHDERHDTFQIPAYMDRMIERKMLGTKSGELGGFYRKTQDKQRLAIDTSSLEPKPVKKMNNSLIEKIKLHLHDGYYRNAIDLIKKERSEELSLVRHFILGYISYSFARIGEVTPAESGIHGIDRVMSYGFSWFPPSAWVDYLGGPRETIRLIEKSDLPVPKQLKNFPEEKICRIPEVTKYLIAR